MYASSGLGHARQAAYISMPEVGQFTSIAGQGSRIFSGISRHTPPPPGRVLHLIHDQAHRKGCDDILERRIVRIIPIQ